jgi:paraquat-inducible protein A
MKAPRSFRNQLAFLCTVFSFCFLVPGIYLSMLTISTSGSLNANIPHIEKNFIGIPKVSGTEEKHIPIKIFDTSRSILKTIHDLCGQGYYFVGIMILIFSVIVPFVKGILLTYIFFNKKHATRAKIFTFIKSIGKWSMCDVFIVAVFLAYLSTGATQTENLKQVTLMGMSVDVHVLAGMQAHLHAGFWCFLTYCLLSLLALQLYKLN